MVALVFCNTRDTPDMAPPLREDEGVGYWSPRTANIDWCEGNYEVRGEADTSTDTDIAAGALVCFTG